MVCLVTDRCRLAGADAPADRARRCVLAQLRFAVEAEVEFVQVRERDLSASELAALVREMLGVTRGSRTRIIVNDRLDVALACGADGVHLRGDSIEVSAARRIAPRDFMVGRSVHSFGEAMSATDADYLIAGTVFPSPSKDESTALLGVDGLRAIARRVRVPVLAIGGVSESSIEDLARAGVAGCAAIGLFMAAKRSSGSRSCRAMPLRAMLEGLRQRFDNCENRSLT